MSSKVIIITGASRGIGEAMARFLLAPPHSCNLVLLSRSNEALAKIQAEASNPKQVEIIAGDAADFSLGQKAVDIAVKRWGKLDGVLINHGMLEPVQRIVDADIDEWREAFDVNVFSTVSIIKAAIHALRETRGRIILTSSGAAVKGTATWGAYGAAKAVLNHLALTLQQEEKDIMTMAIRPGVVDTQMQETLAAVHFEQMDEADAERFRTLKKEGKMLRPDQPGNVMARLVLDAPMELCGSFLNWNDEKLKAFQD